MVVPARTSSTAARFQREVVGATTPRSTVVPATGYGAKPDWTQNVSLTAVLIHSWTSPCPARGVRPTADSQSLPTPKTSEPGYVVVMLTTAAPLGAPALVLAAMPAVPVNVTTVNN